MIRHTPYKEKLIVYVSIRLLYSTEKFVDSMCSIEQYRVGAPKPYNIATSVHWRCAHMTQSLLAVGNRIMRVAFYYNIDMICLRHKDG